LEDPKTYTTVCCLFALHIQPCITVFGCTVSHSNFMACLAIAGMRHRSNQAGAPHLPCCILQDSKLALKVWLVIPGCQAAIGHCFFHNNVTASYFKSCLQGWSCKGPQSRSSNLSKKITWVHKCHNQQLLVSMGSCSPSRHLLLLCGAAAVVVAIVLRCLQLPVIPAACRHPLHTMTLRSSFECRETFR